MLTALRPSTSVQTKDVEVNFSQMFVNTVEGLEAAGARLEHVHFVSGAQTALLPTPGIGSHHEWKARTLDRSWGSICG